MIRIGSVKNTYPYFEKHVFQWQFRPLNIFPLTFEESQVTPYRKRQKNYTKTQIRKILSGDFQNYCKEMKKKGVEIIQNDVKIYTGSETYSDKRNTEGQMLRWKAGSVHTASAGLYCGRRHKEWRLMHGINGDSHRYTCRTRSQCVRTVRCICKKIERALHVTLIARGESVKIMGDALKVEKAKKCWISL